MNARQNLHGLLALSAEKFPDRPAVVHPNHASLTYGDLASRVRALRALLVSHGVECGDRVGICATKSVGTVASLFGILEAEAGYVPVDPTSPASRNLEIFQDCSVRAIIADGDRATSLGQQLGRELKVLGGVPGGPDEAPLLVLEGLAGDSVKEGPPDLAYILYTSGSTGKPKGVVHTHASALSFVDWCSRELSPTSEDRFSSHAPFHFDLSILDLFVPIQHGAAVVLIGEEVGKQPLQLTSLVEEQELTVWYSTPSILRLMLEYGKLEPRHGKTLRLVLFAGEVFPLKYLRALKDVWAHPRYYNLYGPTETNVCTYYEVPGEVATDRVEPLPIGQACSGDVLRIVSADRRLADEGSEGELLVAGGSVMLGYWNRPELTEAAFTVDGEGTRWYRTGDIVVDEGGGALRFLGRKDRMVKRRGYRVELGEIEAALYRHPRVVEAAIVGVPDPESGVIIKAFLSCQEGVTPSMIELKRFCVSNLPKYMIPDHFKVLPELPKTSTDKIDYQTLARMG